MIQYLVPDGVLGGGFFARCVSDNYFHEERYEQENVDVDGMYCHQQSYVV